MSKAWKAGVIICILSALFILHSDFVKASKFKKEIQLSDSRESRTLNSTPTPKPTPTLSPTPTPTPKKTPVQRTRPKLTPAPHRYFFDYQFQGWHYFQQGPGAYKRQVLATPTPRPSPPPDIFPGIAPPETLYRPIPRITLKNETEFSPTQPSRQQNPTPTPTPTP